MQFSEYNSASVTISLRNGSKTTNVRKTTEAQLSHIRIIYVCMCQQTCLSIPSFIQPLFSAQMHLFTDTVILTMLHDGVITYFKMIHYLSVIV